MPQISEQYEQVMFLGQMFGVQDSPAKRCNECIEKKRLPNKKAALSQKAKMPTNSVARISTLAEDYHLGYGKFVHAVENGLITLTKEEQAKAKELGLVKKKKENSKQSI